MFFFEKSGTLKAIRIYKKKVKAKIKYKVQENEKFCINRSCGIYSSQAFESH
jgi:hypothetical protein